MPRRYGDRFEVRPLDTGPSAVSIMMLAAVVAVFALTAGWLAVRGLFGDNPAEILAARGAPRSPAIIVTPVPKAAKSSATAQSVVVAPPAADWELAEGHFYTQSNGQPALASNLGFAVTNSDGVPLWYEFEHLGGVKILGYPLSSRFNAEGWETQVFQRAMLQWNPQEYRVLAVNLLDELHNRGKDDWLLEAKSVPRPLPGEYDRGRTPQQAMQGRLAILALDPAMQAFYFSAPDPVAAYGLPASQVTDMGTHYALRMQRGVLQRWKVDQTFARAGEVTAAHVGQFAIEAGFVPAMYLKPEPRRLE